MVLRIIIFLFLNFAALGIGGFFTSTGVSSDWYTNMNQAPWTPPGWVFGAAWTSIMICFSVYMAEVWKDNPSKGMLLSLYALQWLLNVAWNPIFFKYQAVFPALLIILALTLLIGYILFVYSGSLKWHSLWIAPYFIWLLIASSLNAYIYFYN